MNKGLRLLFYNYLAHLTAFINMEQRSRNTLHYMQSLQCAHLQQEKLVLEKDDQLYELGRETRSVKIEFNG